MPDRYGEPRPNRDQPQDLDPEPDYAGAAARGMAALRAKMGWTQPTTPTQPSSAAHRPHSASNTHPGNG